MMHGSAVEVVDAGLRSYMIKVFNYMGLSLCVTALTAYLFGNVEALFNLLYNIDVANRTISMSFFGWIVMLSPLVLVFVFHHVLQHKSMAAVQAVFWLFSALFGASMASIFMVYTAESLTRVFLITAAMFGAMSLYGYTTKRDLSKIGSFLIMGVWGLVIASLVNIFMQSSALSYAISYVAVVAFTGLTAYDMQNIKSLYYASDDYEVSSRKAVAGALSLYLDFVNLFLALLRLMGDRR